MAALMAIGTSALVRASPAEISAPSKRDNNKPAEYKPAEGGHHGSRRDNYAASGTATSRTAGRLRPCGSRVGPRGGWRASPEAKDRLEAEVHFEQMLDSPYRTNGKTPPTTPPALPLHERATSHFRLHPTPTSKWVAKPARKPTTSSTTRLTKCTMAAVPGEDATYIIFTPAGGQNEPAAPFPRSQRGHARPPVPKPARSVRFSRVLIDGGSSINILYRDTARKLGIQEAELRPTPPSSTASCQATRAIRGSRAVMFGKPDNFRTENIEFEVVDLVSPYHALLGRPALTKFWRCPTTELEDGPDAGHSCEKQLIGDAVAMAGPQPGCTSRLE
ncbi:hypothetical protein QYE76_000460 [Lolium multiflorum]|uniref:Uncharacterized protein n=1 Tax=Lolium multiflorum TaxID=4521 RepID=A0AAD8VVY4_LOLMU|nr:hypothetical protein QYE76_000460 [Lolium multiflorum]